MTSGPRAENAELRAFLSAKLNGDAEHDLDEDGVHQTGDFYRGKKGGQEELCDGCRWERKVRGLLRKH